MAKNKLSRDLERYENMVLDEIKRIVKETAELLQQSARARAPVDTGDLKGSIEVVLDANGLGATVIVQKHYAIYIEYGTGIHATGPGGSRAKKIPWTYFNTRWGRFVTTSGMKKQPFWFESVDEAERFFHAEIKKLSRM